MKFRYLRRRTQCKTGRPGTKGLSWWYFRPYCCFGIKYATKLTHWGWGVNYWSHPHKSMEWAWLNKYDLHSLMWCNDLSMTSFQISCISNSCWSDAYFSAIMYLCTCSNSKPWKIFQCRRTIYGIIFVMILLTKWHPRRENHTICTHTITQIARFMGPTWIRRWSHKPCYQGGYALYSYIGYTYRFSETWNFAAQITYNTAQGDQNGTCIAIIYLDISHSTLSVKVFHRMLYNRF